VQVGLRELLGDCEQLVLLRQLIERLVELEPIEDVPARYADKFVRRSAGSATSLAKSNGDVL